MKKAWLVVLLVGGYICWQLLADIGATKMVQFGSVIVPGGTFIYAITFTWRDLVHKKLGRDWARSCIVWAGAFNLAMAAYLAWVGNMTAPAFYAWGDAWGSIFGLVPRIVIASILAEIVAQLIDTEVYHLWVQRLGQRWQWSRVLASNAISVPVDSLLFGAVAFAGTMPWMGILGMAWGQVLLKGAITLISLPFIYLIKDDA